MMPKRWPQKKSAEEMSCLLSPKQSTTHVAWHWSSVEGGGGRKWDRFKFFLKLENEGFTVHLSVFHNTNCKAAAHEPWAETSGQSTVGLVKSRKGGDKVHDQHC
jgi:hypothetical protein